MNPELYYYQCPACFEVYRWPDAGTKSCSVHYPPAKLIKIDLRIPHQHEWVCNGCGISPTGDGKDYFGTRICGVAPCNWSGPTEEFDNHPHRSF